MKTLLLTLFLLTSCANYRIPDRGLSMEERHFYVIQSGYVLTKQQKDAFVDGKPMLGMNQDLIFNLYGSPHKRVEMSDKDKKVTLWIYYGIDNKEFKIFKRFVFTNDSLTFIRIYE